MDKSFVESIQKSIKYTSRGKVYEEGADEIDVELCTERQGRLPVEVPSVHKVFSNKSSRLLGPVRTSRLIH